MIVKEILVVDDDWSLRQSVALILRRAGFAVSQAPTASFAMDVLTERLHLLLVDWMLPDIGGLEFMHLIRGNQLTSDLPVIILTARAEEVDKVTALDSGADDYVTKPFSPRELVARIRAVLRTSDLARKEQIAIRGVVLDRGSHRVSVAGRDLHVGPTEYRLLEFLMRNSGRIYRRSQLLGHLRGADVYVDERAVDTYIGRIRRMLRLVGCNHLVQTVRGVGYLFSTRPSESTTD